MKSQSRLNDLLLQSINAKTQAEVDAFYTKMALELTQERLRELVVEGVIKKPSPLRALIKDLQYYTET